MPHVKLRTLAAALALTAVSAHAGRAQAPASALRIDINIPENRLRVYAGDSLVKSYRVSVGLPGHETPDGEYSIDHAEWNPWWRPPQGRAWAKDEHVTPPGPNNPMGRVKLFFAPYYYIHGSPHVRELGTPASHGCVRMLNADVVELARLIHARNRGSLSDAQITALLAHPSQTRGSTIAVPVPLRVRYDPVVIRGDTMRIFRDIYSYQRIHSEAVIQALMAAGYDPSSAGRDEIQRVLDRASASKSTLVIPLASAFPSLRRAE
jgi:murein L,D-transpeptidase YcbB/YkuD